MLDVSVLVALLDSCHGCLVRFDGSVAVDAVPGAQTKHLMALN